MIYPLTHPTATLEDKKLLTPLICNIRPMDTSAVPQEMTLEDALKVMWLANISKYHKPLGELLASGYLTQDKLKWAAERAYNPDLKQAAQIILKAQEEGTFPEQKDTTQNNQEFNNVESPPINININKSELQTIKWPFDNPPNTKGIPIAELATSNQLNCRDLGYAVDKAWDPKIKQTAAIYLCQKINQAINETPPPAGPLRQITRKKRSHGEIKVIENAAFLGARAALVFCGPLILWLYMLTESKKIDPQFQKIVKPIFIFLFEKFSIPRTHDYAMLTAQILIGILLLIILAIIVAIFFLVWKRTLPKKLNEIRSYQRGVDGENKVAEALFSHLDGEWLMIRNLDTPGKKNSDIDITLVGSTGVIAMEVKNWEGNYKNIKDTWYYENKKGDWIKQRRNPTQQADTNWKALWKYLVEKNIDQYVTPVIVWANQKNQPKLENEDIPVWSFDRLSEELANFTYNKAPQKPQQEEIEKALKKLFEEQNKEYIQNDSPTS